MRRQVVAERSRRRGVPTSDETDLHRPGKNNWSGFGFDLHPAVTVASIAILVAVITPTLVFPERAAMFSTAALALITDTTGWFLILSSNLFLGAVAYFALGRFGRIRLGGKHARPEFSTVAWLAMLLSAGMGIGLMFWSVGEPMTHYSNPSPMFSGVQAGTPEAAQAAMAATFFHWGIHPWSMYALVGLGLAFFAYNRGLPLTIRSVFHPLIGQRIHGFWGNLIDVVAVLATLAGLATSLGLGVTQVNSGLDYLVGLPVSTSVQVGLIAAITVCATLSVAAGLDGGVKRLSELNMGLAALLLVFVLAVGPTVYLLSGFTQNLGYYLTNLPEMSLWTETFRDSNWQGSWTVFYWAWWISWSPFVGMFIARVSKGRTIREFVLGVLLVPTLLSFVWMSVFGGTALYLQSTGAGDISAAVDADVATALFSMFQSLPLPRVLSIVGVVLVVVFFITSSDSGSLVVDHLTSGGKLDSPVPQRVFWATVEGLIAAVLLIGGGLTTLQTAAVATGLPFAIVLLLMIYSIYVGLREETLVEDEVGRRLSKVIADDRLEAAIGAYLNDNGPTS